ncbi:MAG TPA: hypothetical protein VN688_23635 [Gemmataceae bacterium]|nr:hypothetical protein [Gemmataceae bacterium]
MHDIFSREPDPLDDLLAPPPLPSGVGALRQQMYGPTSRVLRRRRWARQFAYAAALAASFALGLLVMRANMRPMAAPLPEPVAKQHEEPRPPDKPSMPADASALAREWKAFDSIDQRGERYRQAGDRYMEEESDLQSALRCYSSALDSGTERDQAISSDDNWLLMAIKDARQKEKEHAKNGG